MPLYRGYCIKQQLEAQGSHSPAGEHCQTLTSVPTSAYLGVSLGHIYLALQPHGTTGLQTVALARDKAICF